MTAAMSERPAGVSGGSPRAQIRDFASRHRSITIVIGMALISVAMVILPQFPPLSFIQSKDPWYDAFANAGVFVLLAIGLNVVIGLAGLLDLGYAAFFAIGSYTYAYSNSPFSHTDLPFLPMLLVGAAVAAVFGIALGAPTLRLRGDYLAIMTLGFGEIVPIVFTNADPYTLGTNGIGGIYRPEALPLIGEFTPLTPLAYFWVMLGIVAIAMILLYRMQDSRIGRAWNAIREDELAAAANGINTVTTKLLAFAIGATTAGLAGVFNASKLTIVSPEQFYFTVSFSVAAMVVLGGMGNIWGVAVGAFVLYMIQGVLLHQINTITETFGIPFLKDIDFTDYTYLLFGGALILMMLKRPEGLFPSQRRRRELHVAEELEGTFIDTPETIGARGEAPGAEEMFGEDAAEDVPARPMTEVAEVAEVLRADKVTKRFGGLVAVSAIDFTIPERSIVSLIGPNGAGKTTFFNVIAGIYDPSDGRIDFRGRTVIGHRRRAWLEPILWLAVPVAVGAVTVLLGLVGAPTEVVIIGIFATVLTLLAGVVTGSARGPAYQRFMGRFGVFRSARPNDMVVAGLGRTFQNIRLFPNMTALENVQVGMHARMEASWLDALLSTRRNRAEEMSSRVRAEELLALVGLAGEGDDLAKNLPYGDQRRLEIARAIASDPVLLLLDEPTAGMNPNETRGLTELIGRLRRDLNLTILLIEHDMKVVMGISDRVTVLDHGEKIAEGTPDQIRRDPKVIEAYLGAPPA